MVRKFLIVVIFSLFLTACSIPGFDTAPTGYPAGEIEQPQIMYDGQIYYYWATGFGEDLPASYQYAGSVKHTDNHAQPSEDFAGCQLEKGQRVFTSPDYASVVYVEYNDGYAKFSPTLNSTTEHSYRLEELSFTVIDQNGQEVYAGQGADHDSMIDLKPIDVKSGYVVYWFPANASNGFVSGKDIAVNVSMNTSLAVSKTFGITEGDSSSSLTKNISDILYTGTSGHWKLYMKNTSSENFKITGGILTWGE